MAAKQRPYQYYDSTISICSTCLQRVDAKIVFQDGCMWMLKRCPAHGAERALMADDIGISDFFLNAPVPSSLDGLPGQVLCVAAARSVDGYRETLYRAGIEYI